MATFGQCGVNGLTLEPPKSTKIGNFRLPHACPPLLDPSTPPSDKVDSYLWDIVLFENTDLE